jgi:hypothetical protein
MVTSFRLAFLAHAVFDHFDDILGSFEERVHTLDLELLELPQADLSQLNHGFSFFEKEAGALPFIKEGQRNTT